jgi:acid phosphatase
VEENHSYSEVIGNSSMPYLNSLASNYGLATQYYANLHPSISDYFMLTTGQPLTLDDTFTGTVNSDNVVRDLTAKGKTWKSYAESLPSVGYTGGDVLPYMKHHNPFVYFTDVLQQPAQLNNVVPFTDFASDLSSGHLPNFSFIIPNVDDDAHTGSLAQADSWLQANIAPLINSSQFQQNGLLIITFDEGDLSDLANGGGHVATVIVSGKSKKKFQSTTMYQHQSTLRTILQALGVTDFPGASSVAPAMNEFFQ